MPPPSVPYLVMAGNLANLSLEGLHTKGCPIAANTSTSLDYSMVHGVENTRETVVNSKATKECTPEPSDGLLDKACVSR